MNKINTALVALLFISACTTASQHRADVQDDTGERVTVGTVQRDIRIGMSGADVLNVIGSPNIVSSDADRNEVWVYDKFATDVVHSESESGVLGIIFGPIGSAGGAGIGGKRYSAGASSKSQRTLTVVINFDGQNRVNNFAYHTSRF